MSKNILTSPPVHRKKRVLKKKATRGVHGKNGEGASPPPVTRDQKRPRGPVLKIVSGQKKRPGPGRGSIVRGTAVKQAFLPT